MLTKYLRGIISDSAFPKVKHVFIQYVVPFKRLLLLAMLFMAVFALLEAASVKILEPIFNEVFIDKNKAVLGIVAIQVMFIFIFKSVAQYLQAVLMNKVGISMVELMQKDLFRSLIRQDVAYFSAVNSSSLLIYFMSDMFMIRSAVLNGFTSLVKDSLVVIFMIGLMFWKSFEMAAVMFFLFPLGIYPVVYLGRKVKGHFTKQQFFSGNLFAVISQSFQGIRTVKSYQMEDAEIKKVEASANDLAGLMFKVARTSALSSPVMEFLSGIAIAATLSYGGWRITQGTLTTGAFMVFLLAIVAAYKPMKNLARLNMTVQIGVAAIDRVFAAAERPIMIKDSPDAVPLQVRGGGIEMRELEFSYVPGCPVLHGVSINIKPGQTAAIVGLAGSGKSTLISLLERFYEADAGEIMIDGQDIRHVTLDSLHENIAYVSQEVMLFEGTIADNIRIGKPEAPEEEIEQAARRCGANVFIEQQPAGYHTQVGERGGNLSGGQKQLVSIARAMLKNAPILLLDEPTSSLDSKSEHMVQNGLKALMHGRTTIIIAHRLSSIRNADIIYVMEGGRLLECGRHDHLMALGGRYAQLYQLQHGGGAEGVTTIRGVEVI